MQSETIPLQARDPPMDRTRPMPEFKIRYRVHRDNKGKESVYEVYLPPTLEGSAAMQSTTMPLQARHLPVYHKRLPAEFKIDYQTRRDHRGNDSVCRVLIPSTYKGYVIMAEKKDATSLEAEELSSDFTEASAEDLYGVSVPKSKYRARQREADPTWCASLNTVNGPTSSPMRKPGKAAIKEPHARKRNYAPVSTRPRNKHCPICGDYFAKLQELKHHFFRCVHRNGNPQGNGWNGVLSDERRIGVEIAEQYCSKDGGGDQESSTSDGSSGGDARTMSYEPSDSYSHSHSSSSRSPTVTPCLSLDSDHDTEASSRSLTATPCLNLDSDYNTEASSRSLTATPCLSLDSDHDTEASSQGQTPTEHGYGDSVTDISDKEMADRDLDILKLMAEGGAEGQAETHSKVQMDQSFKQLRDPQLHTSHPKQKADVKAWVLDTPETPVRHESEAEIRPRSGLDDIHGDFDAACITPQTTVPIQRCQRKDAVGNAYSIPTPLTAQDLNGKGSPGRSPDESIRSLISPANNMNRQLYQRLLPSPLSAVTKRQTPSEPSPLAQGPKRQRTLPSGPANLPQARTPAGASCQFNKQRPKLLPASSGGSALNVSENGPKSGEKVAEDHVHVHQSKGAGLRINTQVAESAARLSSRNEPTRGEKLFADYIKAQETFHSELENLTHELTAANRRANEAELRAQEAENKAYRANSTYFARWKESTDNHKADLQDKEREYRFLQTRCYRLEHGMKGANGRITELEMELQRERQASVNARSQKLNPLGPPW